MAGNGTGALDPRRRRLLRLAGGATLAWSCPLPARAAADPVSLIRGPRPPALRMVYFRDYPPYSWTDGQGRLRGWLVDIFEEAVARRLGVPVEHSGHPWARAQAMVRAGDADAFCTVPTDERRGYTIIGRSVAVAAPVLIFACATSRRLGELRAVRTIDQLKGFRLSSYIGSGWAREALVGRGLEVEMAPDLGGALRLVAHGRVDATVDNADVVRVRMGREGIRDGIVELSQMVDSIGYHLCIGRGSPAVGLMPAIDRVLADMAADGTLRGILARTG
ncbi:MAG TPA: transporter substrate-binding domain-containing protein [Azospirillaceae bacterium]|nr:transporter substrate-binding domain-containing protein [Azospirillaceae bacterium]